jgi:hypothetical protein
MSETLPYILYAHYEMLCDKMIVFVTHIELFILCYCYMGRWPKVPCESKLLHNY